MFFGNQTEKTRDGRMFDMRIMERQKVALSPSHLTMAIEKMLVDNNPQ